MVLNSNVTSDITNTKNRTHNDMNNSFVEIFNSN